MRRDAPGNRTISYSPLVEDRRLFDKFTKIISTADVTAFAHKYCLLFREGERISLWKHESEYMRNVVALWEVTRLSDVKKRKQLLKQYISWKPNGIRYAIERPAAPADLTGSIAAKGNRYGWLIDVPQIKKDNLLLAARYAIQKEINLRLENENLASLPRIVWAGHTGARRQQITIMPRNLLGALWLQFARAITSSYDMRVCPICGNDFTTGPGTAKRGDAQTCGTARCKKAWQRRKKIDRAK